MMDQDFDRANEKAWLIGAAYDFSRLLTPGLSGNFNVAWGVDAISPSTRKTAPNQAEYDFTAVSPALSVSASVAPSSWAARAAVWSVEAANMASTAAQLSILTTELFMLVSSRANN
jgi:hypothetical protein